MPKITTEIELPEGKCRVTVSCEAETTKICPPCFGMGLQNPDTSIAIADLDDASEQMKMHEFDNDNNNDSTRACDDKIENGR